MKGPVMRHFLHRLCFVALAFGLLVAMSGCDPETGGDGANIAQPDADAVQSGEGLVVEPNETCGEDGGPACPPLVVDFTRCVNQRADGSCDDCEPGECGAGVCHPELRVCAQCAADSDCPWGVCHPSALFCVGCWNDSQCPGAFCSDANVCVECTEDNHCATGVCNLATGGCIGGCKSDDDCDDSNPCTADLCDADHECKYQPLPDGAACDDGDPCLSDGFCLGALCVAGRTGCCPEPPLCGSLAVPTDADGDGCLDSCICVDGTDFDAVGNCLPECPEDAIACPPGTEAADIDGDGCADECSCSDPSDPNCFGCGSDADCDDGDPCSQDICVNNVCVSVEVPDCGGCQTSCDCLGIGDPNDFAPPCPLMCPTCGNFWGCVEGKCTVTCGAQPLGLESCGCDPIQCAPGTTPEDSDGDGCAETCVCPDGTTTVDGTCATPTAACTSGCDCVNVPLGDDALCEDACAGCKNQMACVQGVCQEVCGTLPPNASACGGTDLCAATGGTWDPVSCGDYVCGAAPDCLAVIGGCDCGPGKVFDPALGCVDSDCASLAGGGCEPLGCKADLGSVDVDGDGCHDVCICDATTACNDSGQLCLKAPGSCGSLGTCAPTPDACPQLVGSPVCGCNGTTYGSACEAYAAGQNIAAQGACLSPPP